MNVAGVQTCALPIQIMVANYAIQNLIREGKTIQIPSAIQSGVNLGMHTLNSDLLQLVKRQKITKEEALRVSSSPSELEKSWQKENNKNARSASNNGGDLKQYDKDNSNY